MLMETNREKKARGKAKIILWFMIIYKILPSCKLIDIKFKQFVLSIFTFIDA